jgi:predicted RNA-binding protein YlqC (UPF0109 family)
MTLAVSRIPCPHAPPPSGNFSVQATVSVTFGCGSSVVVFFFGIYFSFWVAELTLTQPDVPGDKETTGEEGVNVGAAAERTETVHDQLRAMIAIMAQGIVDYPEEIVVHEAKGIGFVHYEIHCDHRDGGALIGARGKYAEAIRTLAQAAGAVRKTRVTLQIMPRDGDGLRCR